MPAVKAMRIGRMMNNKKIMKIQEGSFFVNNYP